MPLRRNWSDYAGFLFFTGIAVREIAITPDWSVVFAPLVAGPLLTATGFLLRRPLVKQLPGILPHFAGYGGTFFFFLFLMFAPRLGPDWIAPNPELEIRSLGIVVWFAGVVLGVVVLWWLRNSMSIVPQARELVTTGPFRFARHPLYATYFLQNFGVLLRFNTVPVALALILWTLFTMMRTQYEDRVLAEAFPEEHARYRSRVWIFSPALYPVKLPPRPSTRPEPERQESAQQKAEKESVEVS